MASDALEQLLVVQGHDTRATQLRTRRDTLPERAELHAAAGTDKDLAARIDALDAERHRLQREQARLDDEVTSLREKSTAADRALYGGAVSNPRELQALQDEIAALARRISDLEDQELAVLMELEPVDEALAGVRAERAALTEAASAALRRLTAAEAEIDVALDEVAATRAADAAAVPADLLAEYEALRASHQGVGVARLEHGTCQGCHLKLSAVELDRLNHLPVDALVHCEECGRLLVR